MTDLLQADNNPDDPRSLILQLRKLADAHGKAQLTILITPKIARFLLSTQATNRKLSKRFVEKYSAMIRRGDWMKDAELRIDWNDHLIDGQHRLTAVINTNISVFMIVIWGYDPLYQSVIDQGKLRSASDVSAILGDNYPEKYFTIIRTLLQTNQYQVAMHHVPISKTIIGSHNYLIKKYLLGIQFALAPIGVSADMHQGIVNASVTRAYYHENHERLKQFMFVFGSGTTNEIPTPDAALKLRGVFFDARTRHISPGNRVNIRHYHKLALTAVRHFCNGKNIKTLHASEDIIYPLTEIDYR